MKFDEKHSIETGEAELEQVLRNFRESVHGWSEAKYARPRQLAPAAAHHTWKLAVVWALGCVVAIGGLSVGLYERHPQQTAKRNAVQQGQPQQAAAAAPIAAPAVSAPVAEAPDEQVAQVETAEPDANFLAEVDSDVSRQVPSAMEPLAQLMENNSSR